MEDNEEEISEQSTNEDDVNWDSSKQERPKKFSVLRVHFGPGLTDDSSVIDHSDDSNECLTQETSDESCSCPVTLDYFTNEAIPMTAFYRNTSSLYHQSKQRPTLQELRKALLESDKISVADESEIDEDDALTLRRRVAPSATKLGWVKGVLTGFLLNIWGVLLYLRLPWVVGQAGIGLSSVIVLLSAVVTTLTTLSMSAVCTNGEVKKGGAYFLISRSLGPKFGGPIGVIVSVAIAMATALFVVGFAETFRDILKDHDSLMVDESNDIRIVGLITILILLGVAMIGSKLVMHIRMFLLVVSIISILNVTLGTFVGPHSDKSKMKGFVGYQKDVFEANFSPGYEDENFFSVFAVFFPAATGILAGINMSDNLKSAPKAVPKGTLVAILISTLVYILLAWLVGSCVQREAFGIVHEVMHNDTQRIANQTLAVCAVQKCKYGLLNDFQVMKEVSLWSPIVTAGIFSSTLSSAFSGLVGAGLAFQAVSKDHLFPYISNFGVGYGPSNEPRRGYILTFVIASAAIAVGDLNAIAPIISNFFLCVYALINYSVFIACLSRSPGWRPSFKYYNKWLSLLGALLCITVMFLINWWAALLTIFIVLVLYEYVAFTRPQVNWGPFSQAFTFVLALGYNVQLNETKDHIKNFRLKCLVLTGHPKDRPNLTYLASQITQENGLMVYANVINKPFGTLPSDDADASWIRKHKIKAFRTITTAPSLREGVQSMLHLTGLGKLRPNTVVMGFKKNWTEKSRQSEVVEYFGILSDVFELNYGMVIFRMNETQNREFMLEKVEEESDDSTDSILYEDEYPRSTPKYSTQSHGILKTYCEDDQTKSQFMEFAFKEKQRGTIDVWWLYDDGGLTLLIPHLLTLHRTWKNCKLRVMLTDVRSIHRSTPKASMRMARLLKKFRIDASFVELNEGINSKPSEESIDAFRRLPVGEELGDEPIEHPRVLRMIRAGELVREHCSVDTRLVVISLPVPVKDVTTPLMYMSWLEVLSADLPPVLLVRGNQTNVLTFYI